MAKVKLNLGGQHIEGQTMGFTAVEEPWSFYRLEDGTTIKMKLVVSDVIKLPDPDPVTGLPQFIVRSSNVLSVEPVSPKGEAH
jgi:hypothetical protein